MPVGRLLGLVIVALLPASGSGVRFGAATQHNGLARTGRAVHRAVVMQESLVTEDEAALLESISSDPANKKVVLEGCSALSAGAPTSLDTLAGDWCVAWTDLGKGTVQKLLFKLFSPSLKMLSFGALPPVKVNLTSSYNRVTASGYDLLQCFKLAVPESSGGGAVGVAMALRGAGTVSADTPTRLDVQFETVALLPAADADADAFAAALGEAGLAEAAASGAIAIECKPTYIDVSHLTPAMRVHKGASGATYVLRRVDDIPFTFP